MSTTGGSTWDAAFRLADFLELEWENLRGDKATNVLELGAGTGWLGMTLARNVESSTVCLTEQADGGAMDWLQQNLAENVAAQLPLRSVRTEELDWNAWEADHSKVDLPHPRAGNWDLLIGSDLIYSEVGVRYLPRVLKSFADECPGITMLYCHTLHRFDDFDLEFCRAVQSQGLTYRVIAAEGASRPEDAGDDLDPLADDSAGFLEELFPAKRIVIFQIMPQDCNPLPWSTTLAITGPSDATNDGPRGDPPAPESLKVQVGQIEIWLPEAEEGERTSSGIVLRLVNLGPFGSGQHPTTALMLKAMQEMRWNGDMVVCDYGCGSGILGLVALRLGLFDLSPYRSVDNVPDALMAAQQNAKANNCLEQFGLYLPPEEELEKDLDFYARHGDWRSSETG